MPSTAITSGSTNTPAWKRLGLKLKSEKEFRQPIIEVFSKREIPKRKRPDAIAEDKPSKKLKENANAGPAFHNQDPVTPKLARKKSVTFTPETKVEDGDSVKQLFNSWVAEQKSQDQSFVLQHSQPAFRTPEPSLVEEQVDPTLGEAERRVKRVKVKQGKSKASPKSNKDSDVAKPSVTPSRPFLQYLRQYSESRQTWKFNKNHQNHLLKHIFNVEVVPSDHAHHIYAYVRGLQGAVRTRLRDTALAVRVKDIEDGAAGFPTDMSEPHKRQKEYDTAMQEYIATMKAADAPPKLGYEEGIVMGLSDKAMKQRVAKRIRAEHVLQELGSSQDESQTTNEETVNGVDGSQKRLRMNDGSTQKIARKRKQRTILDEDESSDSDASSSSSDESSSDSSTAQNDGTEETTSSSSSSSSGSEDLSESEGSGSEEEESSAEGTSDESGDESEESESD